MGRTGQWWVCIVTALCWAGPGDSRGQDPAPGARSLFEQRYQAWVQYRQEKSAVSPSPTARTMLAVDPNHPEDAAADNGTSTQVTLDPNRVFDNQAFGNIVELGIPALSFMVERQRQDHMLGHALYRITRWRYHIVREGSGPSQYVWSVEEFPDVRDSSGPPDSRVIWLRWWKEGRTFTDRKFRELCGDLHSFSRQRNTEQIERTLRRIVDLGVAALPQLCSEISRGHAELIPVVSILTDNQVSETATREQCLRWWNDHGPAWILPFGVLPQPEN